MMFVDTRGNQDYNKGATFNGKIVINEGKTSEVAQEDTAVNTIDKQLITQDNSLYETKIFTDNTPDKSTNKNILTKYNANNNNEISFRFFLNNLCKNGKVINIPLYFIEYINNLDL